MQQKRNHRYDGKTTPKFSYIYNDLQLAMTNEQNSFTATFNSSPPLCTDT